MIRFGCSEDPNLWNHLINLCSKFPFLGQARKLVDESPELDLVSWSALISGYAQNGLGKESLSAFGEMHSLGVKCNEFTFPSVLKACSITRDLGLRKQVHEVVPRQEHYACMIDLLGRAGKINEAMELVNTMPFQANATVWGALLGAARIHKNVELGQRAAEMLLVLEPEKSGTRLLLANIYASAGMWDNVAKMRKLMKDGQVKKEPGMSWIEVKQIS